VLTTLFLSPYFPVSAEHLLHALNITAELFDPHRIDTIIYRIRKKLNRLTRQDSKSGTSTEEASSA
jgi:DNA-binding response OmpR family regulator